MVADTTLKRSVIKGGMFSWVGLSFYSAFKSLLLLLLS